MQFDAVETRIHRVARGLDVQLNQFLHFIGAQRARSGRRHQFTGTGRGFDEHADAVRSDRRGRHRRITIRLQRRVRDPTDVPELGEDHPIHGVHRLGDFAPTGDLLRRVNARRPRITLPARFDLRAFGDEQTGTGALLVILGHQFVGDIARLRTALAGEGRQDDAVFQGVCAQFGRREESVIHGVSLESD